MTDSASIQTIADRLHRAEQERRPIAPIAADLPERTVSMAYRVQAELTRRGTASGRRLVGRKIGLTSAVVQQQLGVDQPDFGALFADMEIIHGDTAKFDALIQPRIEAEVALVMERDLDKPDATSAELALAVAFVAPALEIVDSRIAEWKISIFDTVADNGSSARYVIGPRVRRLTDVDLELCGMSMERDGSIVSVGSGAACLGNPLRSALWLARTLAAAGEPLRAGDLVLTGALGPMVSVKRGEAYCARISDLGSVAVRFE
jgi:2-keto-4-pentenoate hydratase